ncbi:hypothetical protein LY76DRAFT_667218 [Colletotrichum caudatum]|nr:hypothetical protein LY76DRAFT_667218 [Colletotrichum caudatum]
MESAASSKVDRKIRARQVWRFTSRIGTNSDQHPSVDHLIQECDPGHVVLNHLGWRDDGEEDEEEWLKSWADKKGSFVTWLKNNIKKWRQEYDKDQEHPDDAGSSVEALPANDEEAHPVVVVDDRETITAAASDLGVEPPAGETGSRPAAQPKHDKLLAQRPRRTWIPESCARASAGGRSDKRDVRIDKNNNNNNNNNNKHDGSRDDGGKRDDDGVGDYHGKGDDHGFGDDDGNGDASLPIHKHPSQRQTGAAGKAESRARQLKEQSAHILSHLQNLTHVRAQLGGRRREGGARLDATGRQVFLDWYRRQSHAKSRHNKMGEEEEEEEEEEEREQQGQRQG